MEVYGYSSALHNRGKLTEFAVARGKLRPSWRLIWPIG